MADSLDLSGAVSMALGGMVGGGIYAVLGVVAGITGPAVWAAFLLAGVVALAAGYSYNALNRLDGGASGGSVTFVESYTGNATAAGVVGWTLLVGYVGSMAMYAFAFGEFAVALGLPAAVAGLPTRPLVSVLAVGAFVGLNLLGAETTGGAEKVLVALKVAILLAFGVLGLVYALVLETPAAVPAGLDSLTSFGPVMAGAVSFVAFQGWQLLFYTQESIADPVRTVRRAVYVSIPVAVLVYVLVGVVTVSLVPQAIEAHPHVALKDAAELMASPYGLAGAGGVVVALSALFSTGSAINATLFSTAHFARGMFRDDLLPDVVDDVADDGVPPRMVLGVGAVTAAFTVLGTLAAITAFASLSFLVVFGSMSALALSRRGHGEIHPLPPAVGLLGTVGFFPLLLWHLARSEPETFVTVVVLAVVVVGAELLYFERETLVDTVDGATPGDGIPPE